MSVPSALIVMVAADLSREIAVTESGRSGRKR
jgi:hypothetical protein